MFGANSEVPIQFRNPNPPSNTLVLQNAYFHDNNVPSLFLFSSPQNNGTSQKMVINGCRFENNQFTMMAELDCNGLACTQSLEIHNSTFQIQQGTWFSLANLNLSATINVWIDSSNFTSNVVALNATQYATHNLTVVNSTFANSTLSVFNMSIDTNSSMSINITASQFNQNEANTSGGVLYMDSPLSDMILTVTDSSFTGSRAGDNGGAFYVNTSRLNMTLANTNITGSLANLGGFMYLVLQDPASYANILFSGGFVNANSGGVLYIFSNVTAPVNISIVDTSFSMNRGDASMNGTGTIVFATGPTLALNMVGAYVGNHDDTIPLFVLDGGVVDVSVIDSHFEDNIADSIFALDTSSSQLSFSGFSNTWKANRAANLSIGGGCIRLSCLGACAQTLFLENNTFADNAHNLTGGVLAMTGQNGTVSQFLALNDNIWINNQANDGGCIYISGHSLNSSIVVEGNMASENKAQHNGGFLYLNQTSPSINLVRSKFSDNMAMENGGVFFLTGNGSIGVSVLDCVVSRSTAKLGGVFYAESLTSTLGFNLSQFIQNDATASIVYSTSQNCTIGSVSNQYTNNTDSQFTIHANQSGQFVSDSDQVLQTAGRWLHLETLVEGYGQRVYQIVNISHLTASNPQSWQLLNMTAQTLGNQYLNLLNVNITGEGSPIQSNSSFITMQVIGTVSQFLNVTNSVISQVSGTTFYVIDSNGMSNQGIDQSAYFQNTTLSQLVTSDLGALYLSVSGGYNLQTVEWIDSHWEACQGTLLWANNITRLIATNCQFEQNTALNGPLLAVTSNVTTGGFVSFNGSRFIKNQAKDAIINLSGPTRSYFMNHMVVNDAPLHLWVTNDTSQVNLVSVSAAYMTSTPLLAKWNVSSANTSLLGTLDLTLLNATPNITLLNYAVQPQTWWSSAVVKYVNTTRGCFNGGQLVNDATHEFAVLNPVSCAALNIPPNTTGNVTVTGITVLYPNQTLNISTGVQLQVGDGGCLLLEGDLHLRVDASALPNSQPVLIQGCFTGQFGNVTFDNTNNPHICQVSATYAPIQVMMNLKACDDGLVASTVPVGAIVGGVVGGVAFVALVVILIIYFVKRQQRKQLDKELTIKLERGNSSVPN